MPTPKMGTVTTDVAKAVKAAKAGVAPFKVDKTGIVHAGIGKTDFTVHALSENVKSFMLAISDAKPEALKGKYLKSVFVCSTQSKSCLLDLANVDPSSPKFMLDKAAVEKLGFKAT
jgi:large subunit ribosomal protein L1